MTKESLVAISKQIYNLWNLKIEEIYQLMKLLTLLEISCLNPFEVNNNFKPTVFYLGVILKDLSYIG